MIIRIKYFGQIAELAGSAEEEVQMTQGAKLMDIHALAQEKFAQRYFRISLNRRLTEDMDTELRSGDEIAVLPPFAGG